MATDFNQLVQLIGLGEADPLKPIVASYGAKTVAGASSSIHSAQQEVFLTSEKCQASFVTNKIAAGDPVRKATEEALALTMLAQARMQNSLGAVLDSIAHTVKS
jgi:hypothetical protein